MFIKWNTDPVEPRDEKDMVDFTLEDIELENQNNFFQDIKKNILSAKKLEKSQNLIQDKALNKNTKNSVPVYTGASEALCYIDKNQYYSKLFIPDKNNPDISFANNGDGSSGRNFHIHYAPYYVNQERTIISFADIENISSKFIYYQIKDMRVKFNMNRNNRPTAKALIENKFIFNVKIPKPLTTKTKTYTSYEVQEAIVSFIDRFYRWKANVEKWIGILRSDLDAIENGYLYKTFKG